MKTSSSEACTVRAPVTRKPAPSSDLRHARGRVRAGVRRKANVHRARRTCARRRRRATDSMTGMARAWSATVSSSMRPGRLRPERVGRVEGEPLAVVQQGDAMAALGFVEVRRAHQNRDALLQELGEQFPELAARHRIDAGRRLVEQDHARLVDQRAGKRELLLHAAREPFGQTIAERQELRELQQPATPLLVAPQPVDLGEERDVLVDAQVAVETEPLREVAHRARDLGVVARPDRCPACARRRRRRGAARTAGGWSSSCRRRRVR